MLCVNAFKLDLFLYKQNSRNVLELTPSVKVRANSGSSCLILVNRALLSLQV